MIVTRVDDTIEMQWEAGRVQHYSLFNPPPTCLYITPQ
jgi:hypothetical protein